MAAIFASAPSQNEFLSALREDAGIPWDRVTAFHLDEYIGVEATHPASFRRFLVDRLFAHVPVRTFHGLAGEAPDAEVECRRYAGLLREARPSLAILGIGENGHLAFIDPPMCDFFEPADVRVVELDEPCRHQQVHDGSFATLEEVPRRALSLTIPSCCACRARSRSCPDLPSAPSRPPWRTGTRVPASVLRRHADARFLDTASARAWIASRTYYVLRFSFFLPSLAFGCHSFLESRNPHERAANPLYAGAAALCLGHGDDP